MQQTRRQSIAFFILVVGALLACKSKETDAKVGEVVKFDDSQWEVVSAKNLGTNLQGITGNKTSQGKFIKVEFKVTNLSKKEESILDHPKLLDDKDREFGPMDDQSLYIPDPERTITLESLPPSMMKRFSAIYEVPADAKGLVFQARALSAFGDKKKVVLGM
jgi:hypothetical protein